MRDRNRLITTILGLLCFLAFFPVGLALTPPPDGGYPNLTTAEGTNALKNLTTGAGNTAVGWYSLFSNTDGSYNTGLGAATLLFNIGDQNTGAGVENTATGAAALLYNTTGAFNTANGALALFNNTTGNENTAVGTAALLANTGYNNTAVGAAALANNTSGVGNIGVGLEAGVGVTTAFNVICIGADGDNVDNSCYIGNIFGATSSNGTGVFVNSNGRLGTMTSSSRFKEQIKPMDEASNILFSLKPVSFRYKKEIDPAGTPQFGLVAEEVGKLNPNLVVRDEAGKPYSVRYEAVNAMLLNEFLKAHRKAEQQDRKIIEQEAKISELKSANAEERKQISVLMADLKEQAAQIKKVSDQMALSRPALQMANSR